jgi:hypothetical protein
MLQDREPRTGDVIKVTVSNWGDYKAGDIGTIKFITDKGKKIHFTLGDGGYHVIHIGSGDRFILIKGKRNVLEILNDTS